MVGMPRRPNGIYIPRFRNVKEKETKGFIRGYGYQGGGMPAFTTALRVSESLQRGRA